MADQQDILLREIDEELKQENLQQIWNKYGTLIVGGAFLLVAGVAGFQGWKSASRSSSGKCGGRQRRPGLDAAHPPEPRQGAEKKEYG